MSLQRIGKTLLKSPLNALGFDIVRLRPAHTTQPTSAFQFAPSEKNKHLWLTSLNINTVVDIGAHEGEFAAKIHDILPTASILSFEPLTGPFNRLKENMRSVPNFRAYNYACGDENGTKTMYKNEFAPSSSLLQMAQLHKDAFPFTEHESEESIEVRQLDCVLSDVQLRDNILLKIDVQGYEMKVIAGADQLISRTKLLIVETSFRVLYDGQSLFDDLYDTLRAKGFSYAGNWNQLLSPADGSVLQADAIFVSDPGTTPN